MSNNKQTRFSIRKGLSRDLPTHAPLGEPLFCTDTGAIYVGMGEGLPVKKVTDPELSEQLDTKANKKEVEELSEQFRNIFIQSTIPTAQEGAIWKQLLN